MQNVTLVQFREDFEQACFLQCIQRDSSIARVPDRPIRYVFGPATNTQQLGNVPNKDLFNLPCADHTNMDVFLANLPLLLGVVKH